MLKPNNFIEDIETMCSNKNIEYIDAIILWCEKHNFEIEYAAEMIKKHPLMKSKIQYEAENLNFLQKSARLPI